MPAVERGLETGKDALEFRIVSAVFDAGAGMRDGRPVAAEFSAHLREAQPEMNMRQIHRRLPGESRRGAPAALRAQLRKANSESR